MGRRFYPESTSAHVAIPPEEIDQAKVEDTIMGRYVVWEKQTGAEKRGLEENF